MIEYSTIVTGPLGENCYLLWQDTRAWIIDPGADSEVILRELELRHLTPVCIVLTHGHFDHLGALDELLRVWHELPVYLRSEEKDWCFTHAMNQYPPYYGHQQIPATLITDLHETLTCGGIVATLIHTPGHTPGGQCILIDTNVSSPLCFTGDTLFQGSIGRTDLPGGSFGQLNASLKLLASTLRPETTILPGHGDASTLARELRTNPYLQPDPGY
ncbi:MAG: MBL fold metallo-hydrolase [Kiritimatiellia bacterium]